MKIAEYPTGKQVLQSGAVSTACGPRASSANIQDNASGEFRIIGTEADEREFNKKHNEALVNSLED